MMENNALRIALELARQNNDPYYLRLAHPENYVILYSAEGKPYSVPKDGILPYNGKFTVYDEYDE